MAHSNRTGSTTATAPPPPAAAAAPIGYPRIAIAGGGPGALTLALLLQLSSSSSSQQQQTHPTSTPPVLPVTVFEMRSKPTPAQLDEPSGSLDLHEGSGLAAIRACGLWERFVPLTGDCEEGMIVVDREGRVVYSDGENEEGKEKEEKEQQTKRGRPEIARNNLLRILLDKIPPDCIRWGSKVVKAEKDEQSATTTIENFDYLIGADGAFSRVRTLLPPSSASTLQSSGIHWFPLVIPAISTRHPRLAAYVGRGMFLCLAQGHMVCVMGGVRDSALVTVMLNCQRSGGVGGGVDMSLDRVKQRVLNEERFLGRFGDKVKEVVRMAFDETIAAAAKEEEEGYRQQDGIQLKPLVSLPAGHCWTHAPHATLIGDAAHVMLPSGEGVNLAMWDALDVSRSIEVFRRVLSPKMKECEEEMHRRAAQEAHASVEQNALMFGENGAEALAGWMREMMRSFGGGDEAE
ncbi:hypothetical protein BD289DRAFT_375394 [Coniella lustricola]|uniref:FAD-binding domain-containing protein n=1 Tax=Coniella lustricola TaxID=2025994 RepID=A0A2T2ZYB2_9PEZI|nr:hypothetical protein BD289DRAFT_375394 [Coniella lustricola]